ncbi:MAG: hypothetical protein JNL11_05610 [Bdellovibrionaceae bacterium]|nr:hypothetical protein [Pseudobdellovibrionaceae bacterium]
MMYINLYYLIYDWKNGNVMNMKYFHIHVYFEEKDINHAYVLLDKATAIGLFEVVRFQEKPVGPHPTAMVEMHFKESCYSQVLEWIKINRGTLTAMIHQDTGDDFKDHTDNIQWLGEKRPLDFSFFELILKRPELRINPE